jgi:hypothetical protein
MESDFEEQQNTKKTEAITNMDEVKTFYKESLPKIFNAVLAEPIKGTYRLFSSPSEKTYHNSIFLILTTGILFTVLPLLAAGDSRKYLGIKPFLLTGSTAILCLVVISILSYITKSISGKSSFKNELLTGGLCGIPLSIFICFVFLMSLFSNHLMEDILNPIALFSNGALISLVIFYCLLSMINIFQQSLKSSGTNDAMSWYLSPIGIIFSLYLTGKIVFEFLQ